MSIRANRDRSPAARQQRTPVARPSFRKTALSMGVAAAVAGIASAPAVHAEDGVIEEVTVTGYRASLINAIGTKRDASTIVESVSAEDIGKLPDTSIAEAIARLPGLAAQRLDGRASSIAIRGLGEDFSATTFNGREQVSIGDNRGVEFDVYPSSIMSGVTVYKTPHAGLMTQGIGGTIDMQTVRPLDRKTRTLQVNVFREENDIGQLNPDADETGYRGTFSYIDQYNEGTVGVAIAAATMESPNQEERWNAWGDDGWATTGDGDLVLGGAKPFVRSSTLNRDTVMGVLQFRPNERLEVTADALFIDFEDEKILRGIEIPGQWGAFPGGFASALTPTTIDNGLVTSGVIEGVRPVVRNDYEVREAELDAFGLNVRYDLTEAWSVEADVATSSVEREIFSMESYAGTGRGNTQGLADNIGFTLNSGSQGVIFDPTLDYSDPALIQLGGPLSWGGGNPLFGADDDQDGFVNMPVIEDDLTTFKLSATRDFVDGGFLDSVQVGLYYSDREKDKVDTGLFLTLPQYPDTIPVPSQYLLSPTDLSFIGMGNVLSYDSFAFFKDGNYIETPENLTAPSRAQNTWTVSEEVTTLFARADFSHEFDNSMALTGNVGVQVVSTDQSSDGNAAIARNGMVEIVPSSDGAEYTEVLPSLNLSLHLTDNSQLRIGAARTMSRSRMDRMNASFGFNFDAGKNVPGADAQNSPWSANGGNPRLKPQMADQFDISYEYYLSDEGYIAVAAFWKELNDWQVQVGRTFDFAGFVPTDLLPLVVTTEGQYTEWQNADGGDVSGFELTAAIPANLFSEALDGLGLVASATFLDSSLEVNGNETRVPGLSETITNATLYYERAGFQFRTSVRSRDDFLGEVNAISFSRTPVQVEGSTIWDAQIGYDFSESNIRYLDGLTVTFQALNLNEEPFTTVAGDDARQVRDHQEFGTTYLIGLSYKL